MCGHEAVVATLTLTAALALAMPGRISASAALRADTSCQATADTTPPRNAVLDSLAALWSDDSFTSIVDGQPNAPGHAELVGIFGWLDLPRAPRPLAIGIVAAYTPCWNPFFWNSQFSLLVPLQWGGGRRPRFGRLGLAWQQRWVASIKQKLTVATYLEADLPTAAGTSGVPVILIGVAAKAWGPRVGFLNGTVVFDSDGGLLAWGLLTALKAPLSASAYLSVDYAFVKARALRSSSLIEVAPVFSAGSHLAISPGLVLGLGHRESTARWGAGVRLTYVF
jgi:hypothetical protein